MGQNSLALICIHQIALRTRITSVRRGIKITCRQARIADFGLSVVTSDADNQSQAVQSRCGNLFYQAPELLIGAPAGNSLDIYAFGKQAVECVAGYVVGVSR